MPAFSPPPTSAASKAILAVVLTSLFFAISDVAAQVETRRLPPLEVAWLRYVIFVGMMVFWQRRGLREMLRTEMPFWQIGRGLFAVASAGCFLLCLPLLPIGDATAIAFAAPFIVLALSVPLLGEHVGLRRWLIAGFGLAGVLIIVQPGTSAFQWAALLPLAAAFFSSMVILSTRIMANEKPVNMLAYTALVGFVVLGLAMPFNWKTPEWRDFGVLAINGIAAAIANLTLVSAYRNGPVSLAAPFSYIQLVFAGVLGLLVMGSVPTPLAVIGAAIIALSGIVGAFLENREASARRALLRV